MPALQWCGRRWTAGADDFVLTALLYCCFHGAIGIVFANFSGETVERNCVAIPSKTQITVTTVMAIQFAAFILFGALSIASGRGRILEPSKRWAVPILLYLCTIVDLMHLGANAALVKFVYTDGDCAYCDRALATGTALVLRGLPVLNLIVGIWYVISICLHFDPSGHKTIESQQEYQKLWERRCRIACCCFIGNSSAESNARTDAARTMALLFQGLDIVPTDIAAAFILVQGYQERVQERRLKKFHFPDQVEHQPESARLTNTFQSGKGRFMISRQARHYHPFNEAQLRDLAKIHHFAKFYMGAYGFLLYTYSHLCTGIPKQCATDPCACCRSRSGIHIGDCCYCDNTALHHVVGLSDEDILFTHFKNELFYPCFYVAVDRTSSKPTIVIAIRGTMSMQDTVTDGVASPERCEVSGLDDVYVHGGFYTSAKNVMKSIRDNLPRFDSLVTNNDVVVVGHSLGAGVASLLTILLREHYISNGRSDLAQKFTCIAYAPPGGLLSLNLSRATTPYIIGCFMGKDLVPRLGAHTIHALRDSMLCALATSQKSKSTTLVHCCCPEKEALLSENFDASFEEQQQLRRFQTSKIRVEQRGAQSPMVKQTSSGSFEMRSESGGLVGAGKSEAGLTISLPLNTSSNSPNGDKLGDFTEAGIRKLYPPSNLVHYAKAVTELQCCCPTGCSPCNHHVYCPAWISLEDVQEIVCSPFMVLDHLPDRFYDVILGTNNLLGTGELRQYQFPDAQPYTTYNYERSMYYSPKVGAGYSSFPPD